MTTVHTANVLTRTLSNQLSASQVRFAVNCRDGQYVRVGYGVESYWGRDRLFGDAVRPSDVSAYVFENADLLTAHGNALACVRDHTTGMACLSVVQVVYSLEQAKRVARFHGLKSVRYFTTNGLVAVD